MGDYECSDFQSNWCSASRTIWTREGNAVDVAGPHAPSMPARAVRAPGLVGERTGHTGLSALRGRVPKPTHPPVQALLQLVTAPARSGPVVQMTIGGDQARIDPVLSERLRDFWVVHVRHPHWHQSGV
jgi:hypothetical protein